MDFYEMEGESTKSKVISTEDFLAKVDEYNEEMAGWEEYSWWEGKKSKGLEMGKEIKGGRKRKKKIGGK